MSGTLRGEENPKKAALILGVLVVACWRLPFHFFWADEWGFIADLARNRPVPWWTPHSGHVFPLFRACYLGLLEVFGALPSAFHVAALLVWWGVSVATFDVFRRLLGREDLALFLAAIFAVHPVNSTVVLWSFELCITLQMLFQVLALRLVVRHPRDAELWQLGGLLVIQNLFFANGAFFPIVCAVVPGAWRRDRAVLCAFLTAIFLGMQLTMGGAAQVNADPVSLGVAWASYVAVTLARLCLVYESLFGSAFVAPALAAMILLVLAVRKTQSRAMPLFLAVWFAACSAALVGGRGAGAGVGGRLYYTTLTAAPVLLALCWALTVTLPGAVLRRLKASGLRVAVLCLLIAVAQRATYVFSERNVLNAAALNRSIQEGSRWVPFDDPVIDSTVGMRVDGDAAKDGYLFWTRNEPRR